MTTSVKIGLAFIMTTIVCTIVLADLSHHAVTPVAPAQSMQATPAPTTSTTGNGLSDWRKTYVDGCTNGDPTMEAYCGCNFDYIYSHEGAEGIKNAVVYYAQTGKLDDGAQAALSNCLDEMPQ